MSFDTRPAFVHYSTWDDKTRAHPAMKWMEDYTIAFDSKAEDNIKDNLMAPDHVLVRTTGQKHEGADASLNALYREIYAPFAKWCHVPYSLVAHEVDDGWEMLGFATLYWTLAVPGKQESGNKVKDAQGNEWDGSNPAAFKFHYRKKGDGMQLARTEIAADPTGAVVEMLKRGMMKPDDLMK